MTLVTPDLSKTRPLAAGTYPGRINAGTVGQSAKKEAMLTLDVSLTTPDGETYTRTARVMLEGKGAFNFVRLLRACGFNSEANAYETDSGEPFDTDALIGQELLFVVTQEVYNNRLQDQINDFLAA